MNHFMRCIYHTARYLAYCEHESSRSLLCCQKNIVHSDDTALRPRSEHYLSSKNDAQVYL